MIARTATAGRFARAASVLALSASYFAYVFRLPAGAPFKAGMADWVDPNFINFLLEHWYHSLAHLTSPVSPPMYFPARGTLGYSHGLVLFAPFYVAVRPFLHPFQAYNAAIFLVMNAGAISLYLIFRKFVSLGFIESLLLAAFFVTSPNIINEPSGIWSQRLSVFLIPQLVLLALVAARRASLGLAWAAGLGVALLFTQDFYTAAFAALVSALFLAGAIPLSGLGVGPARLESRSIWSGTHRKYLAALGLGVLVGIAVFVKIYLRAYLEHPAFPEDQLNNALTSLDISRFGVARVLRTYESPRSFELVFLAAALAWVPWFRVDHRVRLSALWFAVVSVIVLAVPLRFRDSSGWDFSVWRTFIAPVPGYSSIRDPKRIIEFYELGATVLAALFIAHLPRRAPLRISMIVIVFLLLAANWNRNVFNFARPIAIYDRWVGTPISIDSSCEAFFIKGASDAYMSRSSNQWSLYAMDAMYISLRTGIPTLNGYSAWWPDGWRLSNPQNPDYAESVEQWIAQNGLRNVCALDIEARTMTRR